MNRPGEVPDYRDTRTERPAMSRYPAPAPARPPEQIGGFVRTSTMNSNHTR
jgi:hypothetical protein